MDAPSGIRKQEPPPTSENSTPVMVRMRQKSDPPSSSDSSVKKLCIVCSGQEADDFEIVSVDLESDLMYCAREIKIIAEDADPEEVDFTDSDEECGVDATAVSDEECGVDAAVAFLAPLVQLDAFETNCFCVLGSTLFFFHGSRKLAFAHDFSSSADGVVKVTLSNSHKICDMFGRKVETRASPTPDGKRVLVFSTIIQYKSDSPIYPFVVDFELYYPDRDEWEMLPGIADVLAELHGDIGESYTYKMDAFNFASNNVMLFQVGMLVCSLNLDTPKDKGWQVVDQYSPRLLNVFYNADESFLIKDNEICVSPMGIYDINNNQSFLLPPPSYADSFVETSSRYITLIGHDSKDGVCKFARVHIGLSLLTNLPHLLVDVFTFNFDKYIRDTGKDGKRSLLLKTRMLKSCKFVLGSRPRKWFFGYNVFPTKA